MLGGPYIRALGLTAVFAVGVCTSPVSMVKRNPIFAPALERNFPDRSIMKARDGTHYSYSTAAGGGIDMQAAHSEDGLTWDFQEGRGVIATWTIKWAPEHPQIWAPDVVLGPNGTYTMFFSAKALMAKDQRHCIGVATAYSPMGPFMSIGDEPWVCDEVGDIDPKQFIDDGGSRWVIWKVDGNTEGHESTPIMLQQVAMDGYTKVGDARPIFDRGPSDGELVEAPSLFKANGVFFLTFSANWYNQCAYFTSYATSTNIWGPYERAEEPLLTEENTDGICGPGGADVLYGDSDSSRIIVWHGWKDGTPESGERYLYSAPLQVVGDVLHVRKDDPISASVLDDIDDVSSAIGFFSAIALENTDDVSGS